MARAIQFLRSTSNDSTHTNWTRRRRQNWYFFFSFSFLFLNVVWCTTNDGVLQGEFNKLLRSSWFFWVDTVKQLFFFLFLLSYFVFPSFLTKQFGRSLTIVFYSRNPCYARDGRVVARRPPSFRLYNKRKRRICSAREKKKEPTRSR